jgi:hypothetical protein
MQKIPELQKAKVTRLTFSEIIKCLRLKVWDGSQNKMIALQEIKDWKKE